MNYTELTLAHAVFRIDPMNIEPVAMNILSIELMPSYQGPKEELVLQDSYLVLKMQNGIHQHAFRLDLDGNILDEDSQYFFSWQEAEEECIIMRTHENRKRDMDV